MSKDVQGFLDELSSLTEKYSIKISACGCCNSPFLLNIANEKEFDILKDNLKYNRKTRKYSAEEPNDESIYQNNGILYDRAGTKYYNEDYSDLE